MCCQDIGDIIPHVRTTYHVLQRAHVEPGHLLHDADGVVVCGAVCFLADGLGSLQDIARAPIVTEHLQSL